MKLSLNELFTDNAVLPHGKPFKVYGNGEGEVTVILNGAEVKTLCQNGAWSVTMPPMECGGPYELTAVCGSETVVQIADLDARNDEGWRSVQRAQLKAPHMLENVRTVISADISETDNIHPPTKKPLAARIVKSFE